MYVNDTYCHQTPKPMGGIQHNTHTLLPTHAFCLCSALFPTWTLKPLNNA